jgi:peptidyl-prolyl cis-trans isomerase D
MLSFMRKNAKSWIIKVLFGIIIIVFVFFYGFSGTRNKKESVLASVGNKKITIADYQEEYKNQLQFYRSIYQGQITDEMIRQMGLKQKALENLIDREVLLQEAERLNIHASVEEIRRAIMESPVFQENGVFSQKNYERALRYYGLSLADYEQSQGKGLIIKKLQDLVKGAARVSEKELWERFLFENEKVTVEYLVASPDQIKEKPQASEQEIDAYYKKHAEEFRRPEMVKCSYIVFSPKAFEDKVVVQSVDLKALYQMDTDRFVEPKKVKARHILLKLAKTDPPEKEQAVKKRAEELLQRLKNGEDFAKLAAQHSEDPGSAEKGGDLGYFKQGDMVKPFEEAAFALKPGELSGLVRTPYGFQILRVEDVKESRTKPFEEVRSVLEQEVRQEEAKKIAREEASRAFNRLFKSKDIEDYAQKNNLPLKQTDFFAFGKSPEDSEGNNAFSEAAFTAGKGELAPIFSLQQNYVLLKVVDKKDSAIPPVQEVAEAIRSTIEREKKSALAKQRAEEILKQLKAGTTDWAAAAKDNRFENKTIKDITRQGAFIPELGNAPALKDAVFKLSKEKPYPDSAIETDKGVVIVKFKERTVPGQDEFQKQKDRLEKQVVQMKKEELFNQFLDHLKANTEIKVDRKLLAME